MVGKDQFGAIDEIIDDTNWQVFGLSISFCLPINLKVGEGKEQWDGNLMAGMGWREKENGHETVQGMEM